MGWLWRALGSEWPGIETSLSGNGLDWTLAVLCLANFGPVMCCSVQGLDMY
jgi:hypothetical protein